MDDPLKLLRERIDRLDDEILGLISQRARLAQEIGRLKEGSVYRPEREAQILQRLRAANGGPLSAETVTRLFGEIVSACRALEQPVSVAYLGPPGTYSEEAAQRRFGSSARMVPCGSIDEVFREVEAGVVGYGLIESSRQRALAGGGAEDIVRAAFDRRALWFVAAVAAVGYATFVWAALAPEPLELAPDVPPPSALDVTIGP